MPSPSLSASSGEPLSGCACYPAAAAMECVCEPAPQRSSHCALDVKSRPVMDIEDLYAPHNHAGGNHAAERVVVPRNDHTHSLAAKRQARLLARLAQKRSSPPPPSTAVASTAAATAATVVTAPTTTAAPGDELGMQTPAPRARHSPVSMPGGGRKGLFGLTAGSDVSRTAGFSVSNVGAFSVAPVSSVGVVRPLGSTSSSRPSSAIKHLIKPHPHIINSALPPAPRLGHLLAPVDAVSRGGLWSHWQQASSRRGSSVSTKKWKQQEVDKRQEKDRAAAAAAAAVAERLSRPSSSPSSISSSSSNSSYSPELSPAAPTNTYSDLRVRAISATFGAVASALLMTPFDVVKTRLQTMSQPVNVIASPGHSSAATAIAASPSAPLTSSACLRTLVRTEGVSVLWSGLGASLAIALPQNILYFGAYDWLKSRMVTPSSSSSGSTGVSNSSIAMVAPLVCGSAARLVTATLLAPLDLMRTRQQAAVAPVPLPTLRAVAAAPLSSVLAMWSPGLSSTLLRDVPFSAVYWTVVENVRPVVQSRLLAADRAPSSCSCSSSSSCESGAAPPAVGTGGFTASFVSGALAGSFAALLTHPFDVCKTQQQVQSTAELHGSSLRCTFNSILKEEGVAGLYRGLAPRLLKVAPACAVMIGCYDVGKTALD